MRLLYKQFFTFVVVANLILINGIAVAATAICPSIDVVENTVSKLGITQQVVNISAGGATWRARSNFTAEQGKGRTFTFFNAVLNPKLSTGGPAAAICNYMSGGDLSISFDMGELGKGKAVEFSNNWVGCGAPSGEDYQYVCCGSGYSDASQPALCPFTY